MEDNKYGLIGEHLSHSISPIIHLEILKKMKLKGSYKLYEIPEAKLRSKIEGFKAAGIKGMNVTIPHKVSIMQYLDNLSPEAEKIGAVNTIAFVEGRLTGYNTDYHGFGMSLKKAGIDVSGKRATVLGTGGVSKAVTKYLIDKGINRIVYTSRKVKDHKTNNDLEIVSYEKLNNIEGDIIINCTPSGMYPDLMSCPVEADIIKKYNFAVDLIYNPLETIFLKTARELGLKSINGLYMLIAQAMVAQGIWNGFNVYETDIDDIYEIIKNGLK